MPEYLSPGVYVEEIDTGPRPIEATNTSTAVFVGFTEKAEDVRMVDGEQIVTDLTNQPTYITNWIQYSQKFGGLVDGAYLPLSVQGFFANGGSKCYIVSLRQIPPAQAGLLNGDSEPTLIARSRKSGLGGMDYRVRIATSANGAGGIDDEEENTDGLAPFDVIVEKRTNAGDWQVKDVRKEVRLEEAETEEGVRQVRVAYRSNKASELIDIVIPDQSRSLAELWPTEQQQSLSIEQKLLAAPTPANFAGMWPPARVSRAWRCWTMPVLSACPI